MAKKSKAEKKAEKAAEQARLEAERLEAERLEAERLEKERIERERQERIRKELERVRKEKEADTLTAQEAALAIADRDRSFLLQKGYRAASESKEWAAFLDCSDLPDVRYEAEINTYVAMWEADPETSLETAVTMCEKAAQICVQLKALIATCHETGDTTAVPRLHDNIAMLRRLTGKKLDYISGLPVPTCGGLRRRGELCQSHGPICEHRLRHVGKPGAAAAHQGGGVPGRGLDARNPAGTCARKRCHPSPALQL
jgi:hypothetical protein